jgi:REP element-mobilizing transposase RayT
MQRGHNRKVVFLIDQDYKYYLDNLRVWNAVLGIKRYVWCFMRNYIHINAESGRDAMVLSLMMKRIYGRQAAYINKLEGRINSLWEGRYYRAGWLSIELLQLRRTQPGSSWNGSKGRGYSLVKLSRAAIKYR